jgi:hypothetical protein
MTPGVLAPVRPIFRDLARVIVPETAELDEAGWAELEAVVEDALAQRPPAVRRQLVLFVRLLDLLPIPRWLRSFRSLDPEARLRFLHAVETSRIFVFRRGLWGVRTLICMGYYARPAAYGAVGYSARLRGWLEHPDASDAARAATRAGLNGVDAS